MSHYSTVIKNPTQILFIVFPASSFHNLSMLIPITYFYLYFPTVSPFDYSSIAIYRVPSF